MTLCSCPIEKEIQSKLLIEGGLCPMCGELFLGSEIIDDDPLSSPDDSDAIASESDEVDFVQSPRRSPPAPDASSSPLINVKKEHVNANDDESDLSAKLIGADVLSVVSNEMDAADFGDDFEAEEPPTEQTDVDVLGSRMSPTISSVEEFTENFPSPFSSMDRQSSISMENIIATNDDVSKSGKKTIVILGLLFAIGLLVVAVMMSRNTGRDESPIEEVSKGRNVETDINSHPVQKELAKSVSPEKPKRKRVPIKRSKEEKSAQRTVEAAPKSMTIDDVDVPLFQIGAGKMPSSLTSDAPAKKGRKAVLEAAKKKMGKFKICDGRIRKNHPDFSGQWVVSFRVDKQGKTGAIKVRPSSNGKGVESCLSDQVSKWSFEPQDKSIKITLPEVVFAP